MDVSMIRSPNIVLKPLKSASKSLVKHFVLPSKIFVWGAYIYESQTKILVDATKDEMWISEALFNGLSNIFGP